MEVNQILKDAEAAMQKAVEHCMIEFGKLRTGRASVSLIDSVRVDYYGSLVPVSQVASVSAPDATQIIVQPWEKKLISPIERAIQAANIGLNPANDGTIIRLPVPPLTEERRKDLVKVARKIAEDSRIGVRNARRDAIELLKKSEKADHLSEDARKSAEGDVQKLTDRYIGEVEKHFTDKEKDIMSV